MNIALGLLIEVVAFAAAAYVVIALRPRLPQRTTDLLLGSVGCVMGVGALLFQTDVAVSTGVLAPLFAGFLLVAHVRALDATGVTLPAWVKIPALGHRGAYASAPTGTEEVEEPVQQPNAATEPEPASGFDPDPLPGEEELLAPPLPPAMPEPAWPSTVVRPPTQTRLPRRGVRRTRVEVRRVGPFSVLKFSLIFYFCVFLVIYLALAIIWAILSASGVIDSLETLLGSIFPPASPSGEISTRGAPPIEIDSGQLFTWLFVAGCIGVVVWSVINVFIAVMYNLISDIVGGIEVTLADRRER
ncbi:MAG TPA: DUF3566 domain-containing protein [Actinomycetota bacterium]|nr:DUF3566 domain-containing protein [Actinomycetota bacterium]